MNNTIQKLDIDEMKLKILDIVSRTPFENLTIDRIKDLLLKNHTKTNYATVYRKIDSLTKQQILSKKMYGMASQISLNFGEKTISLLSLMEVGKFELFSRKLKGSLFTSISEIIKDTKNLLEIKCVLIFGSYAKSKQTPRSDLDLLVVYDIPKIISKENIEFYNNEIKKSMMGMIKSSELRGGPKINAIIVSSEEHMEMITNNENNVGKEAILSHIILKGYEEYWREVSECWLKEK